MAKLGIFGPGQREGILRGERTSPIVIIGQGLAIAVVTLFAFGIIRFYLYYWDWITKNKAHGWFGPPAIIVLVVCAIVDSVLIYEIFDPNYPNPRAATESTRPLWPWSKERMKPEGDKTVINLGVKWEGLLNALSAFGVIEAEEDDDEEDTE